MSLVGHVLCLLALLPLVYASKSSECVQDCFINVDAVEPLPPNLHLQNDTAKKTKFKHFCSVSEALAKCWQNCGSSPIREDLLDYTANLNEHFCNVPQGIDLFESRGKAINDCLRKGKVLESAATAFIFSGGNSSRVPAENLCDMFLSFATFVEIFTNDAGCETRDKSAILQFTKVVYRFEQLKLGVDTTPTRCQKLDDVLGTFVGLADGKEHEKTQPPSVRSTITANQERAEFSLDCMQTCLVNVTNEKLVLGRDSEASSRNDSKFHLFCEIVHDLSDCWIDCPRGLVHDALASITNRFKKQFCEAPEGPQIYEGTISMTQIILKVCSAGIYNELNVCGNGTVDSHIPRAVALFRGNTDSSVAENLCSMFQTVGKPMLSKAYSGCSFEAAELLRGGYAFAYSFLNLKLGISRVPTSCAGILTNVVNSQLFVKN